MSTDANSHPRTVADLLAAAVAAYPDREALVAGERRLSYRDYAFCVAGLAAELRDDIAPGDRVAILLPNGVEVCTAMFAVHALGATVVPLNPLYTERELAEIVADAAPRVLIHGSGFAELVEPVARTTGIGRCVSVAPADPRWPRWAARAGRVPEFRCDPDALAFIQYTGGTTGRSKGVMLTHAAIAINVDQREALLPTRTTGERVLCVMPLFHSYALAMGLYLAARCAATLVILPRYRPDDVLGTVGRERITIFPGSPTIFTGLMSHPDFASTSWASVHTCYSGASALPESLLARWEAAVGAPVCEGYGQTEAGPVLTFNPLAGVRKPGSVGIPVPDTIVQVVDVETGTRVLPAGETGEIRARGPQIMNGYRNRPAETAESLRDGWLHTGDIGEFDADGYLYIRDRKKDMAIVGGYNVYPREIDEVLYAHPAVLDAAAVGAPDAYRGEVVRAYVVLRPGATAGTGDLLEHCRRNLAKYKVPVEIILVDTLPRTGVGKIDRKALRARAL